jgi:phosphoglycolate phosphatase
LRLIVWDFDGTLADSRPLIVAGMEHALKALGLQDLPGIREEWLSQVGLPVEEGLHNIFGKLDLDPAEVLNAYRSFDWIANEHLLQPFPGMSALVHELHDREVKMAIASSKRTAPLQRQVTTLGWAGCFDPIVTPDDVRLGKPHPESLELCLKFHGLEPGEALMIGDTPFDLEMAQRAGVPSVAVGHGFYGREALLECEPKAYAPDVPALRTILLAMVTA